MISPSEHGIDIYWMYNIHYSQKNNNNNDYDDISDYNDIIAALDKLIMLHFISHFIDQSIENKWDFLTRCLC